jgi:hypothetical protein
MKQINEQINPVFLQQTQKLTQFNKILRAVLPAECLNHVKVANIRNQTLMLITDSPVWTTRLRQLSPQILQFVQKNMPVPNAERETQGDEAKVIHHLRISTRYQTKDKSVASQQKKSRRKLHVSKKTAELLSQTADNLEDDQLKTALSKLAAHATKHIIK